MIASYIHACYTYVYVIIRLMIASYIHTCYTYVYDVRVSAGYDADTRERGVGGRERERARTSERESAGGERERESMCEADVFGQGMR